MEVSGFVGRTAACMSTGKVFIIIREGVFEFFQENEWKTAGKLWSRPHVSFCLKKDFFPSSLACRLHVSGKNGHRKRVFSRTLSKGEIFDDAVMLYSCGWMETEVHENDDVTVMDTS